MLAQVANQQGMYLAKAFNDKDFNSKFEYKFMGAMACLGTLKGIAELGPMGDMIPEAAGKLKGFLAFLLWRSAYWSMSVSATNKMLIPMYWFKSHVFGRDISKF